MLLPLQDSGQFNPTVSKKGEAMPFLSEIFASFLGVRSAFFG